MSISQDGGASFAARITDPAMGIILPKKLSEALRMSVADLAVVTGIHRNSLSATAASPRVQSKLREILAIINDVIAIHGDEARAIIFFRHHRIGRLGDKTPAELIATGQAAQVREYLRDFMAAGKGPTAAG